MRTLIKTLARIAEVLGKKPHFHSHNQQNGRSTQTALSSTANGSINGVDVSTDAMSTHPSAKQIATQYYPEVNQVGLDHLEEVSSFNRKVLAPWDVVQQGIYPTTGGKLPGGMSSFFAKQCKDAGIDASIIQVYEFGRNVLGATADVTPFSKMNGDVGVLNYLTWGKSNIGNERSFIEGVYKEMKLGQLTPDQAQKIVKIDDVGLRFLQGQFGEPVEGWPETRWPLLGIYEKEPFSKEEIESHCLDYTDEDIKAHLKVLKGKTTPRYSRKRCNRRFNVRGKASSVYEEFLNFMKNMEMFWSKILPLIL